MKLLLLFFCIALLCISCSTTGSFKKERSSFEAAKVLMTFKSVADMNDSYFVIKENNFIEYYKLLYDSVKNSRYPGKYTKNGDTLLLNFYQKKGFTLLGRKALVNKEQKEIVFFDTYPGFKKKLLIN